MFGIACAILFAGCNKKTENQGKTISAFDNLSVREEPVDSKEKENAESSEENLNDEQNVELKTVKQLKNDRSSFYIRKEVNPYDDNSGNCMFFDKEGNIYGYNIDQSRIFKFDKSFNVIQDAYLDFGPYVVDFSPYEKGFLISFFTGAAFYYDYDFNLKFQAHMQEIAKVENPNYKAYFDETTDILFFIDEDKDIHSIEHPSLDENINQKNYRDPSETMPKLENDEYAPHLTIDKKRNLYIDGVLYEKGYYDYQFYKTNNNNVSLINEDYYINVYDGTKSTYFYYSVPENEKIESITYHPNGDWYFLTINWSTNMHTLWRIENTWDSEWREQWYNK